MFVQKIPISKNKTASACVVYYFVDCAIKYAVKISIFTFPWVSLVCQVFTMGLKSLLISTIGISSTCPVSGHIGKNGQ